MIAVARVMDELAAPSDVATVDFLPPEEFVPGGEAGIDSTDFAPRLAAELRRRLGDEKYDLWFDGKTRFTLAGNAVVV